MGPEIFDRCVGGGKPKGSATAANIPADPKTLCFVRRSWTRPLKTINYAVNRLENDGSGMIFLSNEIIRAFVVDRKLVEREEGEEEREREKKKKPRPCVQICELLCHIAGVIHQMEMSLLCGIEGLEVAVVSI